MKRKAPAAGYYFIGGKGKIARCLFGALVFALAGCGGGGSSNGTGSVSEMPPPPPPPPPSPPPPPTPPPVSNSPPTIEFRLSATDIIEQNQFVLDAEDTTDPENDSIAISMTQVAGPTAERLEDVNAVATKWRAPSLDQNTIAEIQIEIRAEDGRGAVAIENVNIPIRGFSGPGRPVAFFQPGVSLISGNVGTPGEPNSGFIDVIGVQESIVGSGSAPKQLQFFGEDSGFGFFDYLRSDRATLTETFGDVSYLRKRGLTFNFQGLRSWTGEFIVTSEADNEVVWLTTESSDASDRPFARRDSFEIENPCFFLGRNNTGQDFVWIGQRNRGVSVVRLAPREDAEGRTIFDHEIINETSNGRSLCHFITTRFPQRIYAPDAQNNSNFDNLLAVDFNTSELIFLGDTDEDQIYEPLEVIPIETQSSGNLSVVDVFSRGNASLVPRVLIILMSDGNDPGEHRLVVVTQDDENELIQTVFGWDEGIPVAVMEGSFVGIRPGDQTRRDLAVVTNGGQALIFENIVPENAGVATPPVYADPETFEIATGAGSAVTARDDNFNDNVVMVSYPASGEVRVYKPSDHLPN